MMSSWQAGSEATEESFLYWTCNGRGALAHAPDAVWSCHTENLCWYIMLSLSASDIHLCLRLHTSLIFCCVTAGQHDVGKVMEDLCSAQDYVFLFQTNH